MSAEWWVALGAGLLLAAAVLALVRLRARTRREIDAARSEAAALADRLAALERRVETRPPVLTEQEFRITALGDPASAEEHATVPVRVDRQQFADQLLRESVVRVGALAYGVRRALRPEVRNRIRFEVRREVKRARKARKDEVRVAVREWRARQRAGLADAAPDADVRNTA